MGTITSRLCWKTVDARTRDVAASRAARLGLADGGKIGNTAGKTG